MTDYINSGLSMNIYMRKTRLYSIKYNLNGGQIANAPASYEESFDSSKHVDIPQPTRSGYKFVGWTSLGGYDLQGSSLSGYTSSNPFVTSSGNGFYSGDKRDIVLGNEFSVTPGKKYRVYVTAKRTSGNLQMQGGLWYTAMTSGDPYDGWGDATYTMYSDIGNGYYAYYRDVTVPSGKSKAKFYVQLEQNNHTGTASYNLYDMHIIDMNNSSAVSEGTPTLNESIYSSYNRNVTLTANWMKQDVQFAAKKTQSTSYGNLLLAVTVGDLIEGSTTKHYATVFARFDGNKNVGVLLAPTWDTSKGETGNNADWTNLGEQKGTYRWQLGRKPWGFSDGVNYDYAIFLAKTLNATGDTFMTHIYTKNDGKGIAGLYDGFKPVNTISFYNDDGTEYTSWRQTGWLGIAGGNVSLNTPTKSDYTFIGWRWFDGDANRLLRTDVAQYRDFNDRQVYAVWAKNSYSFK